MEHELIPSLAFCVVHGLIGMTEQRAFRCAMVGKDGNSNARLYGQGLVVYRERVGERRQYLVSCMVGEFARMSALQQYNKLISSQSGYRVGAAHAAS